MTQSQLILSISLYAFILIPVFMRVRELLDNFINETETH